MAEKDTIIKGKVKQSGIFSFKDFYSFLYDYLSEEGYDVTESSYSEKVAGDSKQIDLKWSATRKISDYFKYDIKLEWQLLGLKDIEVDREGKKIKTNSGSIEIKMSATLIKDYESKWESQAWSKFLRGIYDRYIIKNRIDQYENKIRGEFNDLIEQAKAFLALEGRK